MSIKWTPQVVEYKIYYNIIWQESLWWADLSVYVNEEPLRVYKINTSFKASSMVIMKIIFVRNELHSEWHIIVLCRFKLAQTVVNLYTVSTCLLWLYFNDPLHGLI